MLVDKYNLKIVVSSVIGESEYSWLIDKEQLDDIIKLIATYEKKGGPSGKEYPLGATVYIDTKPNKSDILF